MQVFDPIKKGLSQVEDFFDRIKLGYKWKYNRFGPIHILPYRGFGTDEKVHLVGRVLDDEEIDWDTHSESRFTNVRSTIERLETDEIPGATVRIEFRGVTLEAQTDDEGFFEVTIEPEEPIPSDRLWHEVEIELLSPPSRTQEHVTATGEILVPDEQSAFAVVSDMDDTVLHTGATSALKMARAVLLNTGATRTPFEGVAAFYRALQEGTDEHGDNPVFYLSSSPINLYGHFTAFLEARNLPRGPLFLKDFGVDPDKFIKSGHESHKAGYIRRLLETYPQLDFVLVGDSGQEDAEIYRTIVEEQADRIRAIYIRDVTPNTDDARDARVKEIAQQVEEMGVPMKLCPDTLTAAQHAAEIGLIDAASLAEIKEEKERDQQGK